MQNQFTAVYQKCGEWWAAHVEELPGANTQGATLEEARENLREAVALMLEVNREAAARHLEGGDVVREELLITTP
jgi:predicted RNase H-like HicB family nuclease